VLLIWTIIVAPVDNILRPILIKLGADLLLQLIIAGVIGGMFAFSIVGPFAGPVVLAVSYTLFTAWINEKGRTNSRIPPGQPPVPSCWGFGRRRFS